MKAEGAPEDVVTYLAESFQVKICCGKIAEIEKHRKMFLVEHTEVEWIITAANTLWTFNKT